MALAVGGQPLSVSFAFFLYYRRQTNMNLHQMFFYKKKGWLTTALSDQIPCDLKIWIFYIRNEKIRTSDHS